MRIVKLTVGMLATNCYVVADEATGKACVIDPGDQAERILGELERLRAHLTVILLTHGHVDHIGGLTGLHERTGAPVRIHAEDRVLLQGVDDDLAVFLPASYAPPSLTEPLADGDVVRVGELELLTVHTPGHTRGSCSFLVEGHLFTGDLLFAGSVGRTDLAGGDTRALIASLKDRVMTLPPETVIHPGHGDDSTLADEQAGNPFLQMERLTWLD